MKDVKGLKISENQSFLLNSEKNLFLFLCGEVDEKRNYEKRVFELYTQVREHRPVWRTERVIKFEKKEDY